MSAERMRKVLAILPELTAQELVSISEAIKAAQNLGGEAAGAVIAHNSLSADEHELLGIIVQFSQNKAIDLTGLNQLSRAPDIGKFKAKVPDIKRYMDNAGLKRNQRRSILYVAVELIHQDLLDLGVAVSSRVLMRHVHRIPALLNRQFPNYARTGLLSLAASMTKQGGTNVR